MKRELVNYGRRRKHERLRVAKRDKEKGDLESGLEGKRD